MSCRWWTMWLLVGVVSGLTACSSGTNTGSGGGVNGWRIGQDSGVFDAGVDATDATLGDVAVADVTGDAAADGAGDATEDAADVGLLPDIAQPDVAQADVISIADASGVDAAGSDADGGGDAGDPDTGPADSGNVDTIMVDAGPLDTGSADTGSADTGSVDSGSADTAMVDAGPADTGPVDTGPVDTGPADTGPVDTGPADTGPADTGPADTGAADTGAADTGPADTGAADSGAADSGAADSGPADSGAADTGPADTGIADSGSADTQGGCTTDKACGDGNVCTQDVCANGKCVSSNAADGLLCPTGVCAVGVCKKLPTLAKGALVITEIQFNPSKVSDANGEWFEVFNPGNTPVQLSGLMIADKSQKVTIGTAATVPAKGYALLGSKADTKINGGVKLAVAYSKIALSNSSKGGRVALLNADGTVIDEVVYQTLAGKNGWPKGVAGRSLQLSGDVLAADKNDLGTRWCWGREVYGAGDRGTPGAANGSCRAGWCRSQWPLSATIAVGGKSTGYLRVYQKGVTDKTNKTDPDPDLQVWAGYGPDASLTPAVTGWKWIPGLPNGSFDATVAKEPNNDEYQADVSPKKVGVYDTAWRISWRGSWDFVYCDKSAGVGHDGAEDGYQAKNAGSLTVTK